MPGTVTFLFLKSGTFQEWRVVSGTNEEKVGHQVEKAKSGRLKTGRRYVFCPYPGCVAPPLQMISQHLCQYHKLDDAEVVRYGKQKMIYLPPRCGSGRAQHPSKGCQDIRSLFSPSSKLMEKSVSGQEGERKSNRTLQKEGRG